MGEMNTNAKLVCPQCGLSNNVDRYITKVACHIHYEIVEDAPIKKGSALYFDDEAESIIMCSKCGYKYEATDIKQIVNEMEAIE